MTPEDVCRHEAGHACAAVVLGVPVKLIDTIPGDGYLGQVTPDLFPRTRDDAVKAMMISLAGLIETADTPDDLPDWPLPDDANPRSDIGHLKAYSDAIRMTRGQWHGLLADTLRLTCSPEYTLLHTAITGMLSHVPRITPDMLHQLITITDERRLSDHTHASRSDELALFAKAYAKADSIHKSKSKAYIPTAPSDVDIQAWLDEWIQDLYLENGDLDTGAVAAAQEKLRGLSEDVRQQAAERLLPLLNEAGIEPTRYTLAAIGKSVTIKTFEA